MCPCMDQASVSGISAGTAFSGIDALDGRMCNPVLTQFQYRIRHVTLAPTGAAAPCTQHHPPDAGPSTGGPTPAARHVARVGPSRLLVIAADCACLQAPQLQQGHMHVCADHVKPGGLSNPLVQQKAFSYVVLPAVAVCVCVHAGRSAISLVLYVCGTSVQQLLRCSCCSDFSSSGLRIPAPPAPLENCTLCYGTSFPGPLSWSCVARAWHAAGLLHDLRVLVTTAVALTQLMLSERRSSLASITH
jgi:hypothetical protein